jgi:hypothetical protein
MARTADEFEVMQDSTQNVRRQIRCASQKRVEPARFEDLAT